MQDIRKHTEKYNNALKNDFIDLLRKVKRPNANIEGLIQKLESSDFFSAPASTKYHCCYIGGLVEHSLNVYYNLVSLVELKGMKGYFDEDSLIICSLLHDLSKMNFYEVTTRNEKVYSSNGSKYDELGRFDWQASLAFKVRDAKNRFVYGNHEETAEFMVRSYIPLTVEESVAILNHHSGAGFDCVAPVTLNEKYERYALPPLLHMADFLATYIDEREQSDE